jgi:hypothetical protein
MVYARKGRSPLQAFLHWLSHAQSGFGICSDEDVERMAHDVGSSTAELRQLASKGPESADLLQDRMAALDLDRGEVARREPATFQDLQRVCTMCSCHRRCARDLERDPLNAAWEDYCPNVTTLKALGVQPWAVRREW